MPDPETIRDGHAHPERRYPRAMRMRRQLSRLELVGARAVIRRIAFVLVALFAVLTAVAYLLPAHRLRYEQTFHSNFDDGGPGALIVLALVLAAWAVTRNRRYGAGYLLGLASVGGAIGALVPVFLEHLLASVSEGFGEYVFAIGILGMFFVGFGLLVLEPILYVGQRRQLERDVDPQFPIARVVS